MTIIDTIYFVIKRHSNSISNSYFVVYIKIISNFTFMFLFLFAIRCHVALFMPMHVKHLSESKRENYFDLQTRKLGVKLSKRYA